jgi:hypothetical protein
MCENAEENKQDNWQEAFQSNFGSTFTAGGVQDGSVCSKGNTPVVTGWMTKVQSLGPTQPNPCVTGTLFSVV